MMRARFEFLSGVREGESETQDGNYLQLGRHSSSNLRFDAEGDLQVSGHHATIFLRGGYYVLRDAGSTNGTFVNGVRLTADHILADEDVIRFGPKGPTVRFGISVAISAMMTCPSKSAVGASSPSVPCSTYCDAAIISTVLSWLT